METLTTTEARAGLSELVSRVGYGGDRIGLTRHGKVLAVLVSPEDVAHWQALEDAADLALMRESDEEGGEIPHDEVKRMFRAE